MKQPAIAEMMTPMPLTILGDQSVRKAKLLMSSKSIRHLPVVEKGKLFGILSDRDIKLAQALAKDSDFDSNVLVRDICLQKPYVVDGNTDAAEVLETMQRRKIGSALITDGHKLIGIFTVTDACRAFAEYLRDNPGKD